MSDDSAAASLLDRVNTLSFPAVAALGAAAGLLMAVLSALSVEPEPASELNPAATVAAAQGAADEPDPGEPTGARSGNNDRGSDGASQAKNGSGAENEPSAGDEPTAGSEEDSEVVIVEPDADPAADADADAAADTAGDAEPDADTAGDEDPDQDPKANAPQDSAPPPPSPVGRTQAERDAEAKMDADELLTAAAAAYQEKRYKDAYRLATRSQRARPRDKAQMLRGRAACRLRDEKNAREIVRSFKLGDDHRKTLRSFCRDRGVRVGL